ncbi:MAG: HmuY family protein [Bacteroidales bacterium]|nr:HmuY family protein [Bacteroidales bacterium]
MIVPLCVAMAACNGIFGGIYDTVPQEDAYPYGFIETTPTGGTIYVDATSYQRWTYLDFHRQTIDTANIFQDEPAPERWDIALHRYDVKTNGGAAAETDVATLDAVAGATQLALMPLTEDIDTSVVVDMSGMMQGLLERRSSKLNAVLGKWLDVNTSSMPPVYTMSNRIYVVRMADSSFAALQFTNYINSASAKGYITIKYRYPIQ